MLHGSCDIFKRSGGGIICVLMVNFRVRVLLEFLIVCRMQITLQKWLAFEISIFNL